MYFKSSATAIAALCLSLVSGVAASEKATSIQFLGDDNKPIANGLFYFYEYGDGQTIANVICRGEALDADGVVQVPYVPKNFMMSVRSRAEFYDTTWESPGVSIVPGRNVIHVRQSGAIQLDIEATNERMSPNGIITKLVVVCYRREATDDTLVKGVGYLGVAPGSCLEVWGLPAGDYRIEIKESSDSKDLMWRMHDVQVANGKKTELRQVRLD
ncbi:MAG TPA: hypothetical protein VGG64_28485 [Pirellulales bacterium]|jgi:hypothetical protein|nr:hypothetical protein [Pirellulales bacterium]